MSRKKPRVVIYCFKRFFLLERNEEINEQDGHSSEWGRGKKVFSALCSGKRRKTRGGVFHPQAEKHHAALVKVLCAELGVEPEALLDFELCLTDTQPAVSAQRNR